jgi:hypothetical protein
VRIFRSVQKIVITGLTAKIELHFEYRTIVL